MVFRCTTSHRCTSIISTAFRCTTSHCCASIMPYGFQVDHLPLMCLLSFICLGCSSWNPIWHSSLCYQHAFPCILSSKINLLLLSGSRMNLDLGCSKTSRRNCEQTGGSEKAAIPFLCTWLRKPFAQWIPAPRAARLLAVYEFALLLHLAASLEEAVVDDCLQAIPTLPCSSLLM